jgi:hypothetical protein
MPSVISLTQLSAVDRSVEADLDADAGPDLRLQFLRQRVATERAASRRGWVWPIRPRAPRPSFEADLRQLRRLARAGFAADDHHLMLRDQLGNLGAPLIDRQSIVETHLREITHAWHSHFSA